MALVCCLMMLTVEATETATRPIQVDMDLVGISMGLLMILGCLVIWEGIKWLVMEVGREYLPGASARKLRRLKRLRDATYTGHRAGAGTDLR